MYVDTGVAEVIQIKVPLKRFQVKKAKLNTSLRLFP